MAETALRVANNPYIPVMPTPAQLHFLASEKKEVLFGGAAGGGKSAALLMAALEHAGKPDYAAILFRLTLTMLEEPGALIPLSHEWLSGKAEWSEQKKKWTFENRGVLSFRYLTGPNDHRNYQGAAYHFIGFDEATQFRPSHYEYMFSRLRKRVDVDIPARFRAASNPGDQGHEYLKRRFRLGSAFRLGEFGDDREFISSSLEDNPHLDIAEYEKSLSNLRGATYEQLRNGNWDATDSGGIVSEEWIKYYTGSPDFDYRIITVDTSLETTESADYSVFQCWGAKGSAAYLVDQIRGKWEYPDLRKKAISFAAKHRAENNGKLRAMHIERKVSGISLIQDLKKSTNIPIRDIKRGRSSKVDRLNDQVAHIANGRMFIPEAAPFTNDFLDEITVFPNGANDDQVDPAVDALDIILSSPQEPEIPLVRMVSQ